MIEFNCNACGKEYRVNNDKIGKRGKCPNCGNLMIVPNNSSTDLIFDEAQLEVSNRSLQDIFDTIQTFASERVIKQFVVSESIVALEVITGDCDQRSQIVAMSVIGDDDEERLIIQSNVGVVCESSGLETALRYASELPVLNVSLDEDNQLMVRMLIPIDGPTEQHIINVLLVAGLADKLEEVIFGWDVE